MEKKILCLHGYAMNAEWFKGWLRPLERELDGGYRFIYPQGPVECPEEEVRAMADSFQVKMPEYRIGDGKNWGWYRASDDKPPHYLGIEKSLTLLQDVCKREGGIDGIIGWSQGTVMSAVLIAGMTGEGNNCVRPAWAVLCGGFRPGDPRYKHLFDHKQPLPTLHVIGAHESEFMRRQGDILYEAFEGAERLDPPVGHVMPVRMPEYVEQIAGWIRARD